MCALPKTFCTQTQNISLLIKLQLHFRQGPILSGFFFFIEGNFCPPNVFRLKENPFFHTRVSKVFQQFHLEKKKIWSILRQECVLDKN